MMAEDRIRIQVSLAVMFVDRFSFRPVTGPVLQVRLEEGEKPVRKAEGYYIFTNLREKEATLSVQGGGYLPVTCKLPVGMPQGGKVTKIFLDPGPDYRWIQGSTGIYGKMAPGTVRCLYDPAAKDYRKLNQDYGGGEEIAVFSRDRENLEGQSFVIDGSKDICICLKEQLDEEKGIYRIEPLSGVKLKKVSTRLLPVYRACSDREGHFLAPLPSGKDEITEYKVFWTEEGKPLQTDLKVRQGVLTKVQWEG